MVKTHRKRDPRIVSMTMSHIRGKNTGIEMTLRRALTEKGYRYRTNSSHVFGHPDIVNSKYQIAIFCDSEFWHGFNFEENKKKIRIHKKYWIPKIERNIARDREVDEELKKEGYTVLRYWGSTIEKHLDEVVTDISTRWEEAASIEKVRSKGLIKTTLCYLENNGSYLMLYRDKKKNDLNEGKWIGVGGHVEKGESVTMCLKREVKEETGLILKKYTYKGTIDFLNDNYPPERMYLYWSNSFTGDLIECDEGELKWIKKSDLGSLPLWDGDRVFLPLVDSKQGVFSLTLLYKNGVYVGSKGPFYKPKRKRK